MYKTVYRFPILFALLCCLLLTAKVWAKTERHSAYKNNAVIDEVIQAHNQFFKALDADLQGDTTLMNKLWLHSKKASYMGPQGGLIIGWKNISKSWQTQAKMGEKGAAAIGPQDIDCKKNTKDCSILLSENGNMAIVQSIDTLYNATHQKTGTTRKTTVFVRNKDGKFKIIAMHVDIIAGLPPEKNN